MRGLQTSTFVLFLFCALTSLGFDDDTLNAVDPIGNCFPPITPKSKKAAIPWDRNNHFVYDYNGYRIVVTGGLIHKHIQIFTGSTKIADIDCPTGGANDILARLAMVAYAIDDGPITYHKNVMSDAEYLAQRKYQSTHDNQLDIYVGPRLAASFPSDNANEYTYEYCKNEQIKDAILKMKEVASTRKRKSKDCPSPVPAQTAKTAKPANQPSKAARTAQ